MSENGQTADRLAATREDLAHFQGVVMTEIQVLHNTVDKMDAKIENLTKCVQDQGTKVTKIETGNRVLTRVRETWREWLAVIIACGTAILVLVKHL